MNGAASGSAIIVVASAIVAMRTPNSLLLSHRRRQDQIEIGARIEGARDRLHRLRDHQHPGQQHARGDGHQRLLVDRRIGIAADHPIGDEMHEDDEGGDGDADLAQAFAPAGGDHRQPIAPGEPRLVLREPEGGAGRAVMRLAPVSATSARNVSSRLPPSRAPRIRVPCRPDGAALRACLRR